MSKLRIASVIFGVMLAWNSYCLPATAGDELLKQGIAEYNASDFGNAAGHLGAALSTDFNNPILHYYLGNCYVHLKQKDGAIREFRIAYALQPDQKVGEYSKQALGLLGASVVAGGAAVPPTPSAQADAIRAKIDPLMDRALSAIGSQGDNASSFRSNVGQSSADGMFKNNSDALNRMKDQMLQDASRYTRRGGYIPASKVSTDDQKKLDSLTKDNDSRKQGYLDSAARQAAEIQNTARNLQSLLNDQAKKGELKLSPAGTNLYIRNYQAPDPHPAMSPAMSPAMLPAHPQQPGQAQPVKSNPGNH